MVRTRIAPSPTGYPHIGTIYQVLFNYAFAKQAKGKFVLRIEDTDRSRWVEGAEDVIYESLEWFGLIPDESPKVGGPYEPYRQSERLKVYKKYAEDLVEKGHAYYCFCTRKRLAELREDQQKKKIPPMYDRHCLKLERKEIEKKLKGKYPHVIRMKIPRGKKIAFNDLISGKIEFDSSILDDQVIIKSDGFPTYHLAVVVDDHLMEISHVFRGKEWISSTPKHVLLYGFFRWNLPKFAHFPLLLNSEGKGKLSKRHGHASVQYYMKEGFLPEAILNYLSDVVWAHPEGKEIYSLEEFVKLIDISKIHTAGARFDLKKLEWMNGEYIRQAQSSKLKAQIIGYLKEYVVSLGNWQITVDDEELIKKTIPLIQTRIKKLSEYWPMCEFFFEPPNKFEREVNRKWLQKVVKKLNVLKNWEHGFMYESMSKIAKELEVSKSKLFMDIRIAITGKKVGPPLFESMEILGKEESIGRVNELLKY